MGGKVSRSHDSGGQDVQAAAKTSGQGGMGAAQENSATAGARAAANGKGWGSEGVQASTPDAKKSLPGTQHAVQEVGAGVEVAPVRAPAERSRGVFRTHSRDSLRSHWSTLEESGESVGTPVSPDQRASPDEPADARPVQNREKVGGGARSRSRARCGSRSTNRSTVSSSLTSSSSSDSGSEDSELEMVLEVTDDAVANYFAGREEAELDQGIEDVFNEFDANKNNALNLQCFSLLFQHIGLQLREDQMKMLFAEIDTSGDGLIERDEFSHFIHECLEGDTDSSSSSSTSSTSISDFSELSTDSQALAKKPMILQVQAKEAKIFTPPGTKAPAEGYFPYLVVRYGDRQKATSSVKRQTSQPKWNENFVFKVADLTMDVVVSCYHWDGRNKGPGQLLGQTVVKVANLLADFGGSESSSDVSSNSGSGSGRVSGSYGHGGRYLGHKGSSPSPAALIREDSDRMSGSLLSGAGGSSAATGALRKKQASPNLGSSPSPVQRSLQSSGTPSALNSALQSTPGRGGQLRKAMKQKGRIHRHGRFKFQESQKWHAFTDVDGVRLGGGSGIRIRLRPWAPAGLQKKLRIERQQSEQNQNQAGMLSLFSFGRQPKKTDQDDFSDSSSSSGSSLSTLAESEDDMAYSSPDEIEEDVIPNWSRKPAHQPKPCDMTKVYRNLFGDQTLQEQMKHLVLKREAIEADKRMIRALGQLQEEQVVLRQAVHAETGIEIEMMIKVVQKRLKQASKVNDMPVESGWGWKPRSRRYTAAGGICENEFADGYGLRAYGFTFDENGKNRKATGWAEDAVTDTFDEEDVKAERFARRTPKSGRGDPLELSATRSQISAAPSQYQHAGAIPRTPELLEEDENMLRPITQYSQESGGGKLMAAYEYDAIPGRAWVEIGDDHLIECTKAAFGNFRSLSATLRWAKPAQADAELSNAEDISGCVAVVKRDPPNLQEKQGSIVQKVLRCVQAGAVGVIIVNTGRGYQLITPEDPTKESLEWSDEWQVPIVCVRDTDSGTISDGMTCSFNFRTNSPSIMPALSEKEALRDTQRSSVRFGRPDSSQQGDHTSWETLEEVDQDAASAQSSAPPKSPLGKVLSPIASSVGDGIAQLKNGLALGANGLRRLTLNIRYKVMPSIGLANMAVNRGLESTGVVDTENGAISPLGRDGKPSAGVFRRAPSSGFGGDQLFGRVKSSASSKSLLSIKRSLSGATSALGLGRTTSGQLIRVASDVVDHDDSSPSIGGGRSSQKADLSETTDDAAKSPMSRFKQTQTLQHDESLDPGEKTLLLSKKGKVSPRHMNTDAANEPLDNGHSSELGHEATIRSPMSHHSGTSGPADTTEPLSAPEIPDSRQPGQPEQSRSRVAKRRDSKQAFVSDREQQKFASMMGCADSSGLETASASGQDSRVEGSSKLSEPPRAATSQSAEEDTEKPPADLGTKIEGGTGGSAWGKLRQAVVTEEESDQAPAEGNETETEEQKKLRKIVAKFQKRRSSDLIAAEQKIEEGREDEMTTKEKLAVFMAEKKLKRALSRAESSASKQSQSSTSSFSRVSSVARTASDTTSNAFARLGSFARTLSSGPLTNLMAAQGRALPSASEPVGFQRSGENVSSHRLVRKEQDIDQILPALSSARPAAGFAAGAESAAGSFKKPKRPDSARPRRPDSGRGPGASGRAKNTSQHLT